MPCKLDPAFQRTKPGLGTEGRTKPDGQGDIWSLRREMQHLNSAEPKRRNDGPTFTILDLVQPWSPGSRHLVDSCIGVSSFRPVAAGGRWSDMLHQAAEW